MKGPVQAGSLLPIDTYEIKGVPGIGSQPAIFFLKQEGDVWRPLTDFGTNTISLPGFPNRPFVLSQLPSPSEMSTEALDRILVDSLLNARNADDWPMFGTVLTRLLTVASDLAWKSGLLAKDPFLIIDRLTTLANSSNPKVATEARQEIISLTSLCHERRPYAGEWPSTLYRDSFVSGRIYQQPGKSPEESERTYWTWKAFSCSPPTRSSLPSRGALTKVFSSEENSRLRDMSGRMICHRNSILRVKVLLIQGSGRTA